MKRFLIGLLLVSSHSMAWETTYDEIDDGYFASQSSETFSNTTLSIYFYMSQSCNPLLVKLAVHDDVLDEGSEADNLKFRVDKGAVHIVQGKYSHSSFMFEGRKFYRSMLGGKITSAQLNEIMSGTKIIVRDVDEELGTDRYTLMGSSRAISNARAFCLKDMGKEWGNSPTKVPAYSGDEWSA